jgi:uncharacterized FlaG/YvyC family protein
MVTLDNAAAVLKLQSNPQPVPHQNAAPKPRPAPKPVSKPKPTPKLALKQNKPEPKPQQPKPNVSSLLAERLRRQKAVKFESEKEIIGKKHDMAMKKILQQAAEKMKRLAEYISENTHLVARDYRVHEGTNRINVKIYDSVTGELIREIPGQDFLDRVSKMEKLMGALFDKLV